MRIQRPRISQPIITQPTITQVTSLEGDGANITGSFSGSFVGELTGPTSASFATRISASEASISTLDGSYATDAELTAASGALAGSITTVQSNLDTASGSLAQSITDNATDISNNGSDITANSSSLAASITTVQSNLDTASGSLASDITTNASDITSNASDITANSSSLAASITTVQTNLDSASGSLAQSITDNASDISNNASDITANSSSLASSITTVQSNLDSASGSLASSITTVQSNLDTASGSLATRLTTIEDDNATQTELDAVSASLAGDLSSLSQSEITTGNNSLSIDSDGTATLTSASVNVLEVGDVYGIGDGSVDLKVPSTAGYVELNHGDSDFIYLDGTNAGIQIDNGGGALEWSFYGGTGLLSAPGEIRIPASNVFSGSVSGPTVTAGTINGTINADNNVVSSSAQTVANLASTGIISQSAQIVSGLLNQDVSLGSGDLISTDGTFSGNVVVQGNLTTTGTVTNINTTDLNVEDKFILLNSGSTAGNGGLIVQNSATVGQGTALFFDDTADRWGLDFAGADATADTATADAYVAAVVESDDSNYQKNGNIRIDALNGEAYIYVA